MTYKPLLLAALVAATLGVASPAAADWDRHDRGRHHGRHGSWHERWDGPRHRGDFYRYDRPYYRSAYRFDPFPHHYYDGGYGRRPFYRSGGWRHDRHCR